MSNITAEVVPQFANIDIMFKAIIALAIIGFFVGVFVVIFTFINK